MVEIMGSGEPNSIFRSENVDAAAKGEHRHEKSAHAHRFEESQK